MGYIMELRQNFGSRPSIMAGVGNILIIYNYYMSCQFTLKNSCLGSEICRKSLV